MPASLSIKNVPDDILERLRERAKRNHRSLQGEVLTILEEATAEQRRSRTVREVLERIRELDFHTDDSTQMIREMRDARFGS